MRKTFYSLMIVFALIYLSACAQINRDNLRYSSIKRGNEIYKIEGKDSLGAAKEHNDKAITLYKEHLKAYKEYIQSFHCTEKQAEAPSKPSLGKTERIAPIPSQPATPSSEATTEKVPSAPSLLSSVSQIEFIWPKEFIKDAIKADKINEELIRALSSTASVAQMRDLLTEPSFPPLLPLERNIELGCLPPPDSAAFEAVTNLTANLKNLMVKGVQIDPQISAHFATSVIKLFEESERTLFLQYALFRLCEMSVNSPAEFRNVYPVVIHDIVRRTAEMRQLATIEAEKRKVEEEKTKQRKLELEIQKTKPDKDSLYQTCIKAKLSSGMAENASIISECSKLVNSKPENKEKEGL